MYSLNYLLIVFLVIVGVFFLFCVHSVHVKYGIPGNHYVHNAIGAAILAFAYWMSPASAIHMN